MGKVLGHNLALVTERWLERGAAGFVWFVSPGTPEVVHSWVQSWHCLTLWVSRWEVSKVRGWLLLAAVSVPPSRWDLAFFQGDAPHLTVL